MVAVTVQEQSREDRVHRVYPVYGGHATTTYAQAASEGDRRPTDEHSQPDSPTEG